MASLLIGEVAARTALTAPTIRYYESIGLIKAPARSEAGYRRYSNNTVQELEFIKKAQALGFSLLLHPVTFSPTAVVVAALTLSLTSACGSTPTSPSPEITRDRAIEIARAQVGFEPTSVDARPDTRQSKAVWIVTLRRADGSHGGLGQFAEVVIDRSTGEVVAIAMS